MRHEGDEAESLGTLRGGEDPDGRFEAAFPKGEEADDPFPVAMKMPLVEMAVADVGEHMKHGSAPEGQEPGDHEVGDDFQGELGPAIGIGQAKDSAAEPEGANQREKHGESL